jgi:hypothetical protein
MKLVFSEATPDYAHYVFPYAVWAFPEPDETPADLFNAGFLPSSRNLDRFYLCRQVRVNLEKFQPSSENRRILRKGDGITTSLVPRAEFDFNDARREFCQRYADARFGPKVMSLERLESLFNSPITSHVLRFCDATGAEIGLATLYLQHPALAYYYYAFYDTEHAVRSLGMMMMTSAVTILAAGDYRLLYLGSCYSANALYKTQFLGAEFFNGFRWSDNLEELKFILKRCGQIPDQHLLEDEEYRQLYYPGDLSTVTSSSAMRVRLSRGIG